MLSKGKVCKIRQLLKEVFPNDKIPENITDLSMGDISSWDSLGNFNLILAIETDFGIRFSMEQMTEIKSIVQIIEALETDNV
jgi:acyl carrier protein